MFGLMKAKTCSAPADVRLRRRMHYCGTCKTIGRLHGHKARLLLNNDTVFLAELLTALSGDDRELSGWAAQYRSYNCLSLPSRHGDMPVALQLAAAATMVMTEFKIADHLADNQGRGWGVARRFFSKSFAEATAALKGWGFPLDELRRCWDAQMDRERLAATPSGMNWDDLLLHYASPTASATSLFFDHGARIACQGQAAAEMRALGQSFGTLIYLLDALEDFAKDARSGDFNPLRLAFPGNGEKLGHKHREKAIGLLDRIRLETESGLETLPIPRDRSRLFIGRLRANLADRTGIRLPIIGATGQACTCHNRNRRSLRASLREAISLGRELTRRHVEEERRLTVCATADAETQAKSLRYRGLGRELTRGQVEEERRLTVCSTADAETQTNSLRYRGRRDASRAVAPFVFAYTAAMALLFPDHVRTIGSARESFGMPFNLILVGSLVKSWPKIMFQPMLKSTPPSGPSITIGPPEQGTDAEAAEEARRRAEEAARGSKKSGGGCGVCCCDADCCDCCECADCCSGCDC